MEQAKSPWLVANAENFVVHPAVYSQQCEQYKVMENCVKQHGAVRQVVCSAVFVSGAPSLVVGVRHYDTLMRLQLSAIGGLDDSSDVQGFVDQFGVFLTRQEAMLVVKESGQPFKPEHCHSETDLYSEGIIF